MEESGLARAWRLCRVLAAALVLVLLSGCGLTHLQDLSFRVDNRLHFLGPKDRSKVVRPVVLRWTMKDFTIEAQGSAPPTDKAGYFAIFVDRSPIKPGKTMKAVATGDRYCQRTPTCPDASYLANRHVYTTTQTTFQLPAVDPIPGNTDKVQLHSIVIVLMNTAGHRIGESHWELDVRVRKLGLG
jgi:hypothetical protein